MKNLRNPRNLMSSLTMNLRRNLKRMSRCFWKQNLMIRCRMMICCPSCMKAMRMNLSFFLKVRSSCCVESWMKNLICSAKEYMLKNYS